MERAGGPRIQRHRPRPEACLTGAARAPRIAILAHVGNENLGDEAIVTALVQNLRRRCPGAELYGISCDPRDTERRHGIRTYAVRSGSVDGLRASLDRQPEPGSAKPGATLAGRTRSVLRRVPGAVAAVHAVRTAARLLGAALSEGRHAVASYRVLRATDLVIIAGSAQLMDNWGGPWAFPFTLFKWSLLAKMRGASVAFASVGVGPLTTRIGRALIRRCLMRADYRSYREDSSRNLVRSLGVSGLDPVVPDLVFSMEQLDGGSQPERGTPVVGINPMPLFDGSYWPEDDRPAYERYLETLARFADWLLGLGYEADFFPTQLRVDPGTIREIRGRMGRLPGSGRRDAGAMRSLDDVLAAVRHMDIVVATRYHGTLFPLLLGKPVLSIAYQPKTRDLMRLVGQEQFAIDFRKLDLARLQERFLALVDDQQAFTRTVAQRIREARRALDRQYDRLLALISRPVPSEEPSQAALRERRARALVHSQPPSGQC